MYLWQRVRNKVWLRVDWMTCDFHSLCEPKYLSGVENDSQGDVCFRPMRLEDLATMRQYFPRELSDRKYNILKERLSEEGGEAFVAIAGDGKPAGYFSTSIKDAYESGSMVTVTVPTDAVYLFDDYVFTQYRGQKIQKKSISYRLQKYKASGGGVHESHCKRLP